MLLRVRHALPEASKVSLFQTHQERLGAHVWIAQFRSRVLSPIKLDSPAVAVSALLARMVRVSVHALPARLASPRRLQRKLAARLVIRVTLPTPVVPSLASSVLRAPSPTLPGRLHVLSARPTPAPTHAAMLAFATLGTTSPQAILVPRALKVQTARDKATRTSPSLLFLATSS